MFRIVAVITLSLSKVIGKKIVSQLTFFLDSPDSFHVVSTGPDQSYQQKLP